MAQMVQHQRRTASPGWEAEGEAEGDGVAEGDADGDAEGDGVAEAEADWDVEAEGGGESDEEAGGRQRWSNPHIPQCSTLRGRTKRMGGTMNI